MRSPEKGVDGRYEGDSMFKGWREEEGALTGTEDTPGRAEEAENKSPRIPGKNTLKE